MTKYFLIAFACLVALGGVGLALRNTLSSSSRAAPIVRTVDAGASAVPVPERVEPPARAVVRQLTGTVEKRIGDRWATVAIGDVLAIEDTVRTADGAVAEMELGGQHVTLHARTEITVGEVSQKVKIVLAEGRLSTAGTNDKAIRIEVRNSDAVAEAGAQSKFDMITTGRGDVTVAAETGGVDLTAQGKTVRIAAGEQATAANGRAPSVPTKIPPSLFLKVSASGGGRQKLATLKGETSAGAVVSINGVRSTAASEGAFELQVPLKEGKNTLVVLVEDARGRRETAEVTKLVDTRAPRLEAEVEWK